MTVSIRESLLSHAQYFDHLVNLIPAKHYATNDAEIVNIKYMKKNMREETKRAFKEQYKQNKKRKLDPETAVSTIEHLQKRHAQTVEEDPGSFPQTAITSGTSSSREDLKLRLQSRLEALRRERQEKESQTAAKNAKQWRQQQLETNAQNRKQKQTQPQGNAASAPTTPSQGKTTVTDKAEKTPKDTIQDVNLTFGKVELNEGNKSGGKHKKKLKSDLLLKQAEERKKQLDELKATQEGKEKVKEQTWSSALLRARGEKVLDNPKLLKKAMKREAKKKEKSSAAWKERMSTQSQAQNAKQQRRKDNLEQRKTTKLDNKKAKREKKLLGPGFEGRKQGFIGSTTAAS